VNAPRVVGGRVEFHDVQATFDKLRNKSGYTMLDAVREINDRVRARERDTGAVDADTIPVRVIRRPVETVSTIKTPKECGVRDTEKVVVEYDMGKQQLREAALVNSYMTSGLPNDAERWCIPGQPWTNRTTVETARAWTGADIPDGVVFTRQSNGCVGESWAADTDRSLVARDLNDFGTAVCYVMPTLVGGK